MGRSTDENVSVFFALLVNMGPEGRGPGFCVCHGGRGHGRVFSRCSCCGLCWCAGFYMGISVLFFVETAAEGRHGQVGRLVFFPAVFLLRLGMSPDELEFP